MDYKNAQIFSLLKFLAIWNFDPCEGLAIIYDFTRAMFAVTRHNFNYSWFE